MPNTKHPRDNGAGGPLRTRAFHLDAKRIQRGPDGRLRSQVVRGAGEDGNRKTRRKNEKSGEETTKAGGHGRRALLAEEKKMMTKKRKPTRGGGLRGLLYPWSKPAKHQGQVDNWWLSMADPTSTAEWRITMAPLGSSRRREDYPYTKEVLNGTETKLKDWKGPRDEPADWDGRQDEMAGRLEGQRCFACLLSLPIS